MLLYATPTLTLGIGSLPTERIRLFSIPMMPLAKPRNRLVMPVQAAKNIPGMVSVKELGEAPLKEVAGGKPDGKQRANEVLPEQAE